MPRLVSLAPVVIAALVVSSAHAAAAVDGSVAGTVNARGLPSSADIVVSLHAPGLSFKPPAAPLDLNQKGKLFMPHVLVAVVGTTVRFLDNDPFEHNVFSPEGRRTCTWLCIRPAERSDARRPFAAIDVGS